jgi:MFS family permease
MKWSRTIWLLSLTSLFTDMASEMLFPVIPLYLSQIGFSALQLGFLEGLAEVTAGISKGYFGNLSDHLGKRLPFVRGGYFLSAISKPLLVVSQWAAWIFFARTLDRLGKGMRTAARDALLAGEATPENKGRVFAFHRSMDTIGAIVGPLVVLIILQQQLVSIKNIFWIAFIPGVLAVTMLFLLKEKAIQPRGKKRPGFFSFFSYWKKSSPTYRRLLTGIGIFFLFNSSDMFLLLRSREVLGGDDDALYQTLIAYIIYNVVYSLSSYPMGIWADKLGMKRVFITGLLVFAGVYAAMGFVTAAWQVYLVFMVFMPLQLKVLARPG